MAWFERVGGSIYSKAAGGSVDHLVVLKLILGLHLTILGI
jgi:hypothetical protein